MKFDFFIRLFLNVIKLSFSNTLFSRFRNLNFFIYLLVRAQIIGSLKDHQNLINWHIYNITKQFG